MTDIKDKQQQLADLIISKKLLDDGGLSKILQEANSTGKTLLQYIFDFKSIDTEELAKVLSEIYAIPYIFLGEKKVPEKILHTIPIEVAENYKMICFSRHEGGDDGDDIKVGIVDPSDFKAFEALSFLSHEQNLRVAYYVISEISFSHVFKQYTSLNKEVLTALTDKIEREQSIEGAIDEENKVDEVIKSAPVAKIVSVIIRHAIDGNASDIHIEPVQKECRVRYRIDGILHTSLSLPRSVHNALTSRIKVLANLKLDETRIPQDGRIRLVSNGREYDFRVSILPLVGEEKVVLRILDTSKGAPTLEELGYAGQGLDIIKRAIKNTSGMFLVTGPTGSGKSTTLFSVMHELNSEGINICTLEDPVEYYVKGVNQSQIRPEIGFTFASGLRSLLRQDPDIIMVGEIRDAETAELAIHSALTGHFMLSTLHTNSAIGAIPRLIDMHVEPFLLVSTLNTVVAQRLARRVCVHCKEEETVPENIVKDIKDELSKIPEKVWKDMHGDIDLDKLKFYHGVGCPRCGGTGYSGRVAVYEVIDVNEKIKDIIVNKNRFTIEDVSKNQDFVTMKQDGYFKAAAGVTSIDEIFRILQD